MYRICNLKQKQCESNLPYTCWCACHPQHGMLFWEGQLTKYRMCHPLVAILPNHLWYWLSRSIARCAAPLWLRSRLLWPMVIACSDSWCVCDSSHRSMSRPATAPIAPDCRSSHETCSTLGTFLISPLWTLSAHHSTRTCTSWPHHEADQAPFMTNPCYPYTCNLRSQLFAWAVIAMYIPDIHSNQPKQDFDIQCHASLLESA